LSNINPIEFISKNKWVIGGSVIIGAIAALLLSAPVSIVGSVAAASIAGIVVISGIANNRVKTTLEQNAIAEIQERADVVSVQLDEEMLKAEEDQALLLAEKLRDFYGASEVVENTVENRHIIRELFRNGYDVYLVNMNDPENPATQIVQNLVDIEEKPVELAKAPEESTLAEKAQEFKASLLAMLEDNVMPEAEADKELRSNIMVEATEAIEKISEKIASGVIDQSVDIRLSLNERGKEIASSGKEAKVAFLPLAANPIQWGHLIVALNALAQFDVSKVIFLASGPDERKPVLSNTMNEREEMAKDLLSKFGGLFEYSSISMEDPADGETQIWKLMELNKDVNLTVGYVVGNDHQHYYSPKSMKDESLTRDEWKVDTIGKFHQAVQENSKDLASRSQAIEILFNKREADEFYEAETEAIEEAKSLFELKEFNGQRFEASSTRVRKALAGEGPKSDLTLLPVSVSEYILAKEHTAYRDMITGKKPVEVAKASNNDINLADIGLNAGLHDEVNKALEQYFKDGKVEKAGTYEGVDVFIIKGVDRLVGDQSGHAGIELNAIYLAEGAYTEELGQHEAIELGLWQQKALELANKEGDWGNLTIEQRKEYKDNLRNWMGENIVDAQNLESLYHAQSQFTPLNKKRVAMQTVRNDLGIKNIKFGLANSFKNGELTITEISVFRKLKQLANSDPEIYGDVLSSIIADIGSGKQKDKLEQANIYLAGMEGMTPAQAFAVPMWFNRVLGHDIDMKDIKGYALNRMNRFGLRNVPAEFKEQVAEEVARYHQKFLGQQQIVKPTTSRGAQEVTKKNPILQRVTAFGRLLTEMFDRFNSGVFGVLIEATTKLNPYSSSRKWDGLMAASVGAKGISLEEIFERLRNILPGLREDRNIVPNLNDHMGVFTAT
jgi:nicotinic acid mononucleotide adenylyltransferase